MADESINRIVSGSVRTRKNKTKDVAISFYHTDSLAITILSVDSFATRLRRLDRLNSAFFIGYLVIGYMKRVEDS